ncbi:acyl-CoA N-acyltransferase [Hyaloscypha variabilis F]|uniref:Acyl-CoA N-acyltransferase n=1 Tax=Hyaloscypha variabilis (strain UAMH 11265 / GT02V1 / F) TaxID=1149755 RepID=A0A2J6RGA4_HYAVF|nr:acyl-CoA N-acyltransferase [Hyaloscypha variabilis F]
MILKLSRNTMYIRQATKDDLDDIVEIHFAAFHDEPDMDYPFPHRREFPDFMKVSTKKRFRSYLAEPEIYSAMVACSKTDDVQKIMKPVAYAAWLPNVNMASPQNASGGLPQPRIGHPTHTPAWRETTANARKTYFDEIYGGRKIELLLLGTRPEYRHRGGASKLVRWGMEMAREHEKTAVVLAGFSGTKFYLKLGFRLVGDIHIQLEGEEDKMDISALVYEQN